MDPPPPRQSGGGRVDPLRSGAIFRAGVMDRIRSPMPRYSGPPPSIPVLGASPSAQASPMAPLQHKSPAASLQSPTVAPSPVCPIPLYPYNPVNKSFQDLCQASPMPKCVQMALQQTSTAARLTSPSSAERRRQQRVAQEQAQLGRSSQDNQWSKGGSSMSGGKQHTPPESHQGGLPSSGERGANGQSTVVSASSSTVTMTSTSLSSQHSMRPPPPVMASLDEPGGHGLAGAPQGRRTRGSGEGSLSSVASREEREARTLQPYDTRSSSLSPSSSHPSAASTSPHPSTQPSSSPSTRSRLSSLSTTSSLPPRPTSLSGPRPSSLGSSSSSSAPPSLTTLTPSTTSTLREDEARRMFLHSSAADESLLSERTLRDDEEMTEVDDFEGEGEGEDDGFVTATDGEQGGQDGRTRRGSRFSDASRTSRASSFGSTGVAAGGGREREREEGGDGDRLGSPDEEGEQGGEKHVTRRLPTQLLRQESRGSRGAEAREARGRRSQEANSALAAVGRRSDTAMDVDEEEEPRRVKAVQEDGRDGGKETREGSLSRQTATEEGEEMDVDVLLDEEPSHTRKPQGSQGGGRERGARGMGDSLGQALAPPDEDEDLLDARLGEKAKDSTVRSSGGGRPSVGARPSGGSAGGMVKRRVQEIMEAMKEREKEKKEGAKKPAGGDTAKAKLPTTTAAAAGRSFGKPTIKTEWGGKPAAATKPAVAARPAAAAKPVAAAKPTATGTKPTASTAKSTGASKLSSTTAKATAPAKPAAPASKPAAAVKPTAVAAANKPSASASRTGAVSNKPTPSLKAGGASKPSTTAPPSSSSSSSSSTAAPRGPAVIRRPSFGKSMAVGGLLGSLGTQDEDEEDEAPRAKGMITVRRPLQSRKAEPEKGDAPSETAPAEEVERQKPLSTGASAAKSPAKVASPAPQTNKPQPPTPRQPPSSPPQEAESLGKKPTPTPGPTSAKKASPATDKSKTASAKKPAADSAPSPFVMTTATIDSILSKRPSRSRIPPLDFWRSEHPACDETGTPKALGAKLGSSPPPTPFSLRLPSSPESSSSSSSSSSENTSEDEEPPQRQTGKRAAASTSTTRKRAAPSSSRAKATGATKPKATKPAAAKTSKAKPAKSTGAGSTKAPATKVKQEKTVASSKPAVAATKSDEEEGEWDPTDPARPWSKVELGKLKDAVQVKVPPTAPNFWQRVAKLLDNRTANSCQKRWFQDLDEGIVKEQRVKKAAKSKVNHADWDEGEGAQEGEESDWELGGEDEEEGEGKENLAGHKAGAEGKAAKPKTAAPSSTTKRPRGAAKPKLRHLVREYAMDCSDDDLFDSTPVKKKQKADGANAAAHESLLSLSFLQDEVFDDDEPGRREESSNRTITSAVNDQYLNRVINQIRPKNKKEARVLAEHASSQVAALKREGQGKGAAAKRSAKDDLKVKETVGRYTVKGGIDRYGRVQARVMGSESEGEEDEWEEDVDEEEEEEQELRRAVGGWRQGARATQW